MGKSPHRGTLRNASPGEDHLDFRSGLTAITLRRMVLKAATHGSPPLLSGDVTAARSQAYNWPGGWGGNTSGTCATGSTPSGVEFEERWPLSVPAGSRYVATWYVGIGTSEHVTSIRFNGNRPPQTWRTSTQPPVPPRLITRARHELAYLQIFPSFPGTKPCTFTGGGLRAQTFHGTCTTKLLPRPGNRRVVAFVERWDHANGGWIVKARHGDGSLVVSITGSNPPQSWR
jgi:hypothetical protein